MLRRLRLLPILLLAVLLPARPAQACTPPVGGLPDYEMADYAAAAPLILRGTVTGVAQGELWETATVQVQRYFRGSGPGEVVIDGFGSGALCRVTVFAGDDLIFFAAPVEGETGRFNAFYLSQFDAVAAASADNIAALEAALDLLPATATPTPTVAASPTDAPPRPTITPTPLFATDDDVASSSPPSLLLVCFSVLVLVPLLIFVYRLTAGRRE